MEIVDAHHHLWDLQENYYPWLTDQIGPRLCGEYSAIRKNYLLEDFRADIGGLNVVKSVHIQAEIDRRDPVVETRWLQRLAHAPSSRGFPHAIVAYADLAAPNVEGILQEHAGFTNVRGIRQTLQHCPGNPLQDPRWRASFKVLRRLDLSFDLQVFPQQMSDAQTLASEYPDVRFILCHAGLPMERTQAGIAIWRDGLRRMAPCPNVAVKLSGYGMFDRGWSLEGVRPFVETPIEIFGIGRCMFGSNFPVEKLASDYGRLWSAFAEITKNFSGDERAKLFSRNAAIWYRI